MSRQGAVWLNALVAASAQGCALWLANQHPLWPQTATLLTALWSVAMLWRPQAWLWALPLGLAFMGAAPWTGWVLWSEWDLLVLASLAGVYAHRAGAYAQRAGCPLPPGQAPLPGPTRGLLAVLACMTLVGLLRAALDVQHSARMPLPAGMVDYGSALNSLRVARSEIYALLCVPLLPRTPVMRLAPGLAQGVAAGLVVVVLAVLWERLAFVSLLDFSTPYRTVALFWDMHVGGAALDGYLVLAAPFAAWALLRARRPWQWLAAALLALLTLYAALTTFSRGVYAALALEGLLLAWLLRRQGLQLPGWRRPATVALLLLLLAEAALVLGSGSFMRQRLHATPDDLGSRLRHWQRGLQQLHSPSDWVLGIGVGRLPARNSLQMPFAAAATVPAAAPSSGAAAAPQGFVTLQAASASPAERGSYALAQRAGALPRWPQPVQVTLRVRQHTTVQLQWCERHLLYDGRCLRGWLQLAPHAGAWQTHTLWLRPVRLGAAPPPSAWQLPVHPWPLPRPTLFSISVLTPAARADIGSLRLPDALGDNRLANADFSQGMAHWLGVAQSGFTPWHIDNVYLELLIERGLLGLLLGGVLLGVALWRLVWGAARTQPLAPYYAAALTGALCVGLFASLLDVPRVAWLLYLLALNAAAAQPR